VYIDAATAHCSHAGEARPKPRQSLDSMERALFAIALETKCLAGECGGFVIAPPGEDESFKVLGAISVLRSGDHARGIDPGKTSERDGTPFPDPDLLGRIGSEVCRRSAYSPHAGPARSRRWSSRSPRPR
jgi:hypothetical protein